MIDRAASCCLQYVNRAQFYPVEPAITVFGHLGAAETSYEHNIDISSPVSYLHIQQTRSNIIIHLESCFWPTDEYKSNISSLLALFLVSTNS